MELWVEGIPEAQARPRVFFGGGRPRAYSPRSAWRDRVARAARLARPQAPFDGPLSLKIEFFFPRLASARKDTIGGWKATRPDLDNLIKGVMDALTDAGWWAEDSRVAAVEAYKVYTKVGRATGARIIVEAA